MTALEAIPKISELLARLIKLSKNRETGALVQQIQEHQLVIHRALVDADAKIRDLERQLEAEKFEEKRIHRLITFRRGKNTGGKWVAFCSKCNMPAGQGQNILGKVVCMVVCSGHCGWHVPIPETLQQVIKELEG